MTTLRCPYPLSIFLAKLTALNGVIPGFAPPPPKLGTNSATLGLRVGTAPPTLSFLAGGAAEGSLAGGVSGQESGLLFGRN